MARLLSTCKSPEACILLQSWKYLSASEPGFPRLLPFLLPFMPQSVIITMGSKHVTPHVRGKASQDIIHSRDGGWLLLKERQLEQTQLWNTEHFLTPKLLPQSLALHCQETRAGCDLGASLPHPLSDLASSARSEKGCTPSAGGLCSMWQCYELAFSKVYSCL